MIQLYHYGFPTDNISTQYGKIAYFEWLQRERDRIEKDKSRKAEIVYWGNKVALFVNEVRGCTCDKCKNMREYA